MRLEAHLVRVEGRGRVQKLFAAPQHARRDRRPRDGEDASQSAGLDAPARVAKEQRVVREVTPARVGKLRRRRRFAAARRPDEEDARARRGLDRPGRVQLV